MALKFYLHNATTTDTGTLPGAGASVATTAPVLIASGVNRSMDATIGTAQASVVLTTNAVTTAQQSLIVRFLSAPIAAQTLAAQTVFCSTAFSESSLNSNLHLQMVLAVWRPGTGAVVGRLSDWNGAVGFNASSTLEPSVAATETTDTAPQNSTTSAVTAAADDVLVLELWRDTTAQTMATAYTNTVFYDGTVEGSATTNAAYLNFTNDVAMSGAAALPKRPLFVPQAVNRSTF